MYIYESRFLIQVCPEAPTESIKIIYSRVLAILILWIRMDCLHSRHQSPLWTKQGCKSSSKGKFSKYSKQNFSTQQSCNKQKHYMDQPAVPQTKEVALFNAGSELTWGLIGSHSTKPCKAQHRPQHRLLQHPCLFTELNSQAIKKDGVIQVKNDTSSRHMCM